MATTREDIVAATTELFRSQGFNGTSLKQISTESGAPTGSIYHFFPNGKDELGAAVITESGAAYQSLLELIADDATDVVEAIGALFDGAAAALEESDFIDICPIGTVAREVASTHESLRQATSEVFGRWNGALSIRLAAAGIDGFKADELATTIVSAIEGGFILCRANRKTEPLRVTGRHMQLLVRAALL